MKKTKKPDAAAALARLDQQIWKIQQALAVLGPMRPGTLTRQFRQPQRRQGAYYQLSYTFQMRSHTEYVRLEELTEIRRELAQYNRYKRLTARWVDLALRRSRLRIKRSRAAGTSQTATPEGGQA